MRRAFIAVTILLGLAACSPRGEIVLDPAAAKVGTVETVFIGTTRGEMPASGVEYGQTRSEDTRFARLDISIPPERELGEIRFTPPS